MAELKGIYIEDVEDEGRKYSGLLSRKGELLVEYMLAPVPIDAKAILEKKPDLVLVDYVLTQKQPNGRMATYRGGTLASNIREEYPDYPIVLVTRRVLLKKYRGAPGQLGPFDLQFFKDEIRGNPSQSVDKLVALASGYRILRQSIPLTWRKILRVLGAKRQEAETLKESKPESPILDTTKGGLAEWSVPEVARWILGILFEFPGVLYNDLHAATALGLSIESLSNNRIERTLAGAKYDGVFGDMERRWWRERLLAEGFALVRKAKLEPPLARSFVPAVKATLNIEVQSSKCVFSAKQFADTVCYVLQKPVLRNYSLAYFPDNRPKMMDEARVSFEAFKSEEFREEFLNSEGRSIFRTLREGRKVRPR